MARIHPFRAWHYNPDAVRLHGVGPRPYDKIPPAVQQADSRKPSYNLVRILFGLPALFDAETGESVYTRAAGDFHAWRRLGQCLVLSSLVLLSTLAPAQALPVPASRSAVVLDAAHGGDDAGATLVSPDGGTELEKAYTLELSVRLRSLLAARGISVITTRESDAALPAEQRAAIANRAGAQACLSLHAAMSGSGVHLFISSLAPAPRATLLPWKTAQASSVVRSIALAGMLNAALTHAGIKVTIGRTALPVIDSITCPAVAVEVAPPTAGLPAHMGDSAYQAQIAEALAAGLLEWRAEGQTP